MSIVARGGEGKTTLVNHWLHEMAAENFREAERVFARSFYSQGTSERAASADKVIDEALRFFGEQHPERLSPYDRGLELAKRVSGGRNLLILDGMEPLQYPPGEMAGEIKDPALEALLKNLQFRNDGLCLVTTREEIRPLQGSVGHEEIILKRLTKSAGRQLLKKLGVNGDQDAIDRSIEEYQGHALAVTLLGTYLVERFDGDIANIDRVTSPLKLLKGGERESAHARKMIAAYEKWFEDEPDEVNSAALVILRFLGLFNRPPEPGCIAALREAPIAGLSESLFAGNDPEVTWQKAVLRLEKARLLERNKKDWNEIDCHPLIREYFADRVDKDYADSARDAHRCIYEYLKQAVPEYPVNLHDMMPLYHAISHGCKAEKYEETFRMYRKRIVRTDNQAFSVRQLGVLGIDLAALSYFFDIPWSKPNSTLDISSQTTITNYVAFLLGGLARNSEAVELFQESLKSRIELKEWRWAALDSSNMSEHLRKLGNLSSAMYRAEQSVELADRDDDDFTRLTTRATLATTLIDVEATVLSNLGESCSCPQHSNFHSLAHSAFREAEALQGKMQPQYPKLYSIGSYLYCELLLKELAIRIQQWTDNCGVSLAELQAEIEAVRNRAETTLKWAENMEGAPILDFALHHLILGQTRLKEAELGGMQTKDTPPRLGTAEQHFNKSVSLLRKAGFQDYLTQGLLQRCGFYRSTLQFTEYKSKIDLAERDLNEAEEIAQRGSMLIYQIEAALERTRLYLAQDSIELAREKLNEAKQLVKQTEKPYEPYVPMDDIWPDGEKWDPPEYVGVFKKGDIVGYHRRNGEIERLERALAEG